MFIIVHLPRRNPPEEAGEKRQKGIPAEGRNPRVVVRRVRFDTVKFISADFDQLPSVFGNQKPRTGGHPAAPDQSHLSFRRPGAVDRPIPAVRGKGIQKIAEDVGKAVVWNTSAESCPVQIGYEKFFWHPVSFLFHAFC